MYFKQDILEMRFQLIAGTTLVHMCTLTWHASVFSFLLDFEPFMHSNCSEQISFRAGHIRSAEV